MTITRQARALKEHRLEELDWENLADEVEGLAKTERRELRSRLGVLLEHIIKWQFQPQGRTRIWRATVAVQRVEIREHLDENPGLKPSVMDIMAQAYKTARVDFTHAVFASLGATATRLVPVDFRTGHGRAILA